MKGRATEENGKKSAAILLPISFLATKKAAEKAA